MYYIYMCVCILLLETRKCDAHMFKCCVYVFLQLHSYWLHSTIELCPVIWAGFDWFDLSVFWQTWPT